MPRHAGDAVITLIWSPLLISALLPVCYVTTIRIRHTGHVYADFFLIYGYARHSAFYDSLRLTALIHTVTIAVMPFVASAADYARAYTAKRALQRPLLLSAHAFSALTRSALLHIRL